MSAGSLQGELALVTGASRGIGAAIAAALAAAGARVVGTATAERGVQAIGEQQPQVEARVLQLDDGSAIDRFVADFLEQDGAPYILVNNAGINRDNLLLRMKPEQWQQVIDVDLSGAWRLIQGFSKAMCRQRRGRIINISSVVGSTGNNAQSNYAAAKAGLEGLTRALALELAPRQINVNAVAPGFIETDMTEELPASVRNDMLRRIPLQRFGSAAEVAEAVCYLAGSGGNYITGITLHVNGGMYMA